MQDNQAIEAILVVKKYNSYENDVVQVLQSKSVNAAVTAVQKSYEDIDVSDTVKRLSTIADLMNLAYIGTLHLSSNESVVSLMTKYLRVVMDSKYACSKFVASSLRALDYHRSAIEQLKQQKPAAALKYVGMAGKIAEEMSVISKDLVDKVFSMCELVAEALEKTIKDDDISNDKRERIRNMIAQWKANQAALTTSKELVRAHLKEAAEEEVKSATQANTARSQASILNIMAAILRPLSDLAEHFLRSRVGNVVSLVSSAEPSVANGLKAVADSKTKQADRASEREASYHVDRMKLQEQSRIATADLTGVLVMIEGMTGEVSKLDKAIFALELTIKSLGRITTVFEDIRVFWMEIRDHCARLEGLSAEESNQYHVHDGMCIAYSWYSWLALCKINEAARVSIEQAAADVKAVMNDLPTEEEANERFPLVLAKLKLEITDDIKYHARA